LCIYKNNTYVNRCKCSWRSYVWLDLKTYKLLSFLYLYISNFNLKKLIK
jgi:hypothetical protein